MVLAAWSIAREASPSSLHDLGCINALWCKTCLGRSLLSASQPHPAGAGWGDYLCLMQVSPPLEDVENSRHGSLQSLWWGHRFSSFFHQHFFGFLLAKKEPNKCVVVYGAAGNEIYQAPYFQGESVAHFKICLWETSEPRQVSALLWVILIC